jgi:hypothetical protein
MSKNDDSMNRMTLPLTLKLAKPCVFDMPGAGILQYFA